MYFVFELYEGPDHALVVAEYLDDLDVEVVELDSELVSDALFYDGRHELLELLLRVYSTHNIPPVSSNATSYIFIVTS
jgi:hypothetical protein